MKNSSQNHDFDKYQYYLDSVQSPEEDANFLEQAYWDARQKKPQILREDFCAAFSLCCEWVKKGEDYQAIGIDLDDEPLEYGEKNYKALLSEEQQNRLKLFKLDATSTNLPNADIICALNFSYMGLKKRADLLKYLKNCYQSLNKDGILVLDCFGGSSTQEPNEHETIYDNFSYFWDQDTFNPVTHEAMFYIHFKRKNERKREQVFTYDWRLWSLAELKDLADEAGFKSTHIYWEGTDEDGEGDGIFSKTENGEECESWVSYLVAEK